MVFTYFMSLGNSMSWFPSNRYIIDIWLPFLMGFIARQPHLPGSIRGYLQCASAASTTSRNSRVPPLLFCVKFPWSDPLSGHLGKWNHPLADEWVTPRAIQLFPSLMCDLSNATPAFGSNRVRVAGL